MDRYDFMARAYELAEEAADNAEVPVGAVIVRDGEIIAEGRNYTETKRCATRHAEIVAIENASRKLCSSNLSDCEIYVTLEPCPMCAGAIINAKLKKVVFGAFDTNYGACGTATDVFATPNIHRPECYGGIMEEKCSNLVSEFFRKIRNI